MLKLILISSLLGRVSSFLACPLVPSALGMPPKWSLLLPLRPYAVGPPRRQGTIKGSKHPRKESQRSGSNARVPIEWKIAVDDLRQLREAKSARVRDYNVAINACAKARQLGPALVLLGDMVKDGIEPDTYSYGSLLNACARTKDWETALVLLDDMEDQGVEQNVVTMSAAISACEKGGQWAKALELLESLAGHRLKPDVITMSAAISACEKGGQWAKALELLESMESRGLEPNVITMSAAIEALVASGLQERACAMFDDGLARGFFGSVFVSDTKIDLHDCSVAVAQTALSCFLRDLNGVDMAAQKQCDVVVITGRGNRSEGEAVLPNAMRAFFVDTRGPRITEVPENPGCFILRREALVDWLVAGRQQRTGEQEVSEE